MKKSIWDDPNLPSDKATAINRDREERYGSPVKNYTDCAKIVEIVMGVPCSPEQAAAIMVGLKFVRECNAGFPLDYADNLEDICGFTNVLYKCKEARRDAAAAEPASK